MGVKVTGSRRLRRNFKRLADLSGPAAGKALLELGFEIFEQSQNEVPIDLVQLKPSGSVKDVSTAKQARVRLAYGTDYALYVHERGELTHSPPTKAFYLKDPIERATHSFARRFATKMKRRIKGIIR